MKLDKQRSYGTVMGHHTASYEQDGVLFDALGNAIDSLLSENPVADAIIETDAVESAKAFLRVVLRGNPVNKSAIYKEAESNNQSWEDVKKAFSLLGGTTFTYNRATMWKLPTEEVSE